MGSKFSLLVAKSQKQGMTAHGQRYKMERQFQFCFEDSTTIFASLDELAAQCNGVPDNPSIHIDCCWFSLAAVDALHAWAHDMLDDPEKKEKVDGE